MKPVRDIQFEGASLRELLRRMRDAGGFAGRALGEAVEVMIEMLKSSETLRFLSFPANIVATGLRGVIREMAARRWFDVFVTTCGAIDHDLARCFKPYYHGSFEVDDAELRKRGINRLGNVFIPDESYGVIIEEKMQEFLGELYKQGLREVASYELTRELGKWLQKEDSFLYWCQKNEIPVIVPGLTDGAVGYQLWMFSQQRPDFKLDLLKDEHLLNELIWQAKSCSALIIGGGISKHHVIWWAQFKGGLDRVVYLTTASEYDGSLSGARTREGISWGKVKATARHVTVDGDATITLPILVAAVIEEFSK